jgi:O-methyltransferase involved in polyketide biosynthesis
MKSSDKIAPTAHYTAYVWHVLGLPYSDLFATDLGRRMFFAYKLLELPSAVRGRSSLLLRTLKNRHALIDGALERLAPDRVVELGAGLSQRGLRFALDHGVRYLEVDLPAMVAYKMQLIQERASGPIQAALRERFRCISADIVSDEFQELLSRELRGSERPVVVLEGVLTYYDAGLRLKLLRSVRLALEGRGALLADVALADEAHARASRLVRLGIFLATRGHGAAKKVRNAAELHVQLARAGFTSVARLPSLEPDVYSGVWLARPDACPLRDVDAAGQ